MKQAICLNTELYSKKNGKQIIRTPLGRTMLISKKKVLKEEENLQILLYEQKPKWLQMIKNRPFPYKLHIFIYRQTKRRFDYINIVQGLFDVMQDVGYLPDDDANHLIPIFEGYDIDKNNPRTIIWFEDCYVVKLT